jgi:hypothetical protein
LGRRYVGLINGRIRKEPTEEIRRTFDIKTFVEWANDVAQILKRNGSSNPIFDRFMPACAAPPNPVPRTICLDLLQMNLTLMLSDGVECRLKSSCSDVQEVIKNRQTFYHCRFEIEAEDNDDKSIVLGIEYQPLKERFWFNKVEGAPVHVSTDQSESAERSLADFLNRKQEIILMALQGGEIVYQDRTFYKVEYEYAEKVLLDLIVRPKNAPTCSSEKGNRKQVLALKKSKATSFQAGTIFKAIAEAKIDLPFQDELLICDDLGTECADFIAVNFKGNQMALIHAKKGSGSAVSASDFHDVVSQAMKNLVYLTRNSEIPAGVKTWTVDAKWNRTGIPKLWRKPPAIPFTTVLWNKIKNEIIESSNPELFVVLATTGCCDPAELRNAVTNPGKRTPEVAQLVHLLDGLNGYARQLGVRVLIRDLPYKDIATDKKSKKCHRSLQNQPAEVESKPATRR